MEIFGGFMMMASILGFFLTVIWFILPFVIFSIKGKVDRTLILAEEADRRLGEIETRLARLEAEKTPLTNDSAATLPAEILAAED
ncbi:hypothetical protein Geob_1711 [Geotalea daltonii FRC-32]|uniref:Uncharacterized protein n=1 Tax=Geotalea daltonii (strain DSM 22248 / JCM 15807 / FRC-32) TaxID=316067 RepID=B9M6K9_GEODF|nr:hypothetical protein [Geotalea daltonii]ACM20069.1 hypothetical protein Geob_1711 [Geotalea daltonii FRC-32]